MRNRTLPALAAVLALAAPAGAAADSLSLTLGVWGGVSRYDVLGLRHGVGEVRREDGKDLIKGDFDTAGASALLRLGWFEIGALYEGTLFDAEAKSEVVTPLVGFKWDLTSFLRLDVLAELGGHRITDIGAGNDVLSEPPETVWLPYAGIRPGLSLRLPLGPTRFVVSATPFARWDLVKKEITYGTGETQTVYEAGGTTFGVVGGLGLEI